MADNFCGPSNALQNFQKHSSVDRTLQQDRLSSRQSPSQGFRSSPGPNAGLLDPEFEAFQAGQLPQQQFEPPGFQQPGFSHAPPNLSQAGPSNWATDFQRLSISNTPPPQFHQQSFNSQSQQRHDTGGWHQDFARQQQNLPAQSSTPQLQHSFQPQHQYGFNPMSTMSVAPHFAEPLHRNQIEQSQQASEIFDEEAFARAFEEASKAEMQGREEMKENIAQDMGQQQNARLEQEILLDKSAERLLETDPVIEHRLGADLIHDPQNGQETQNQNDPDALARTAAQLLDSVRNNTSEKFQNSQFLELMRQFRDKEAVVEGDKIVGASGDGIHEGFKVAEP
ncbi:hypothetical protein BP5796_07924 [Coleophoma crateriformis]|uniref:Peroxin 20 n=1 Tax=Coleophoma crateriformis TaxID=565419 RepID=A0A3D8RD46_9HELO|nr:hypothetical protein BP5796_07924 [Coleophoma crateriformis]